MPTYVRDYGAWKPVSGSSGDSLPNQSGNSGKYLTTDGTSASWATLAVASGANMQVFTSNGTFTPTSGKTTFLVMATGGGGAGGGEGGEGNWGGGGGTGIRFYNATELGANASVVVGGGGTRYFDGYWGTYLGTAGGNSSFDPAGTGLTLSGLGGGASGIGDGGESGFYYPAGTGGGTTNSYWAMNGYGETPFWGPGPGFGGFIANGSNGIIFILEW